MALELLTQTDELLHVSDETKRHLLKLDIQMWANTRWQAEMRHRGFKRVGNTEGEAGSW